MDLDTEGGQGGSAPQTRQAMITVNNLNYLLEPDLSVAVNVTHKDHFFQSQTYTNNQRAICILNSGADYIDTTRSFLNFTVALGGDGAESAYLGQSGSILNLINRITVSSRSGDELTRIRKLNLLAATKQPWLLDKQWHMTVGDLIAYGRSTPSNGGWTVSIPLYLLSDFFGYGRLMPAMLMSGLRIEIEWEDPAIAFQCIETPVGELPIPIPVVTTGADSGFFTNGFREILPDLTAKLNKVPSYEINNIFISAKSVQLTDSTQRALNELSAVNGLEIVYCDWETTEMNEETDRLHMEVRKASSRALKALVRIRDGTAVAGNGDAVNPSYLNQNANSMASEDWNVTQYQWQLGSLYFPQQPVRTRTGLSAGCVAEAYCHALDCFDKLQPNSRPPLVRMYARAGTSHSGDLRDTQGFNTTENIVGVTLERSSLFNLAGIPINNSRVLSFQPRFGVSIRRNVTIFLKYVKLARVFLNNVEVEQ